MIITRWMQKDIEAARKRRRRRMLQYESFAKLYIPAVIKNEDILEKILRLRRPQIPL